MTVAIRRQKKEKIEAINAAAAAKGTDEAKYAAEDQVAFLMDALDCMMYLVDYPQTKAETLAFSKYSNSLNGVFSISEIPRPPKEVDEDEND